ncbi:Cdc6/Cdc18 family protein [Halobium salinum]|uniref:Cdc6/Cdc18 family protein n=1 Tax=Halobium salinum TaxID=1364940 RepID=A0ABD5PEB4_9EURY|nr:AAA family ATPase [Halobium salinum]
MFKDRTSNNATVFQSESVLTSEHQPEEPFNRDSEIQKIADALRPLTDQVEPVNVLAYGPAGTGKTTCIEHVSNRLKDETSIKPISINCWQYNTRPSLLTQLLIELGYPAPRKGKPIDELLNKLEEWADKSRGLRAPKGYAIILDEFDQLKQKSEVIYDIQRLNREVKSKFGLVMISNQQPSRLQLNRRSRSRVQIEGIEFPTYTAEQLTQILKQRAEQAFYPGTVDEDVIRKVAEAAVRDGGDCRRAIHLLRRLGREADNNGLTEVSQELLDQILT